MEWCIPILWPIDLLNLPRRGPRPTLKTETRLIVKVMDDTEVPVVEDPDRDPSGLYRREPSAYDDAPQVRPQRQIAQDDPGPAYQPPPPVYQPQQQYQQQYQQPQYQQQQYQPPQQSYVPPAPVQAYMQVMPVYVAPAPTVYVVCRSASSAAGAGLYVYAAAADSRHVVAATHDVLSERVCISRGVWVRLLGRCGSERGFSRRGRRDEFIAPSFSSMSRAAGGSVHVAARLRGRMARRSGRSATASHRLPW